MKFIKKIALITSSLSIALPIVGATISCSNSNNNSNTKLENLKSQLSDFVSKNRDKLNADCVELNVKQTDNVNFFNILSDPSDLGSYFSFNKKFFPKQENVSVLFAFNFDSIDSFGNHLVPTISENKSSIIIPVLIYFYDSSNNIQATKYINLFTMDIKDGIVNNPDHEQYDGVEGKKVVFKNSLVESDFETVPKQMVDQFLEFISFINSSQNDYRKLPVYQYTNEDLEEWKGKTLSEVKTISNAITAPASTYTKNNTYNYSIVNSYFYENDRKYASFVMKISLSSQNFPQMSDAKTIYGFSFEKEYSIVDKRWAFKNPTESDIESYRSNNQTLMKPLLEEAKTNILLYTPSVLINPFVARDIGVEEIVKRFDRGVNDFGAPASFEYIASNEQVRKISFSIDSLESVEEDSNVVKINIKMTIGEKDLAYSDTFSKEFNILSWKFV